MFQCTNSWPVDVWNIHLRRAVQEFSYSTIFRKLVYLNCIRTGREFWNHGEQVRESPALLPAASFHPGPEPPLYGAIDELSAREILRSGKQREVEDGGYGAAAGTWSWPAARRAEPSDRLPLERRPAGSEGWGRSRAQRHIATASSWGGNCDCSIRTNICESTSTKE